VSYRRQVATPRRRPLPQSAGDVMRFPHNLASTAAAVARYFVSRYTVLSGSPGRASYVFQLELDRPHPRQAHGGRAPTEVVMGTASETRANSDVSPHLGDKES
jgi:hypothetical protein